MSDNVVNGGDNVFTFVCVRALTVALLMDFDEIWHRRLEPEVKDPFRWGENPLRVPLFLPHFTPNWHLHNAFQWEC